MYIDITSGSFAFDSGVQLYVWNESTSTNTLLNNQLSLGDSAGWQAVQVVLSASTATHVGFRFTVTSEFGAKIYLDNVQFN
jgi:hypothetical protein